MIFKEEVDEFERAPHPYYYDIECDGCFDYITGTHLKAETVKEAKKYGWLLKGNGDTFCRTCVKAGQFEPFSKGVISDEFMSDEYWRNKK